MCGRLAVFGPVSLSREAKAVCDQMDLDLVSTLDARDGQFNLAPTQHAVVVAHGDDGFQAKPLKWGLIPSWAKEPSIGSRLLNARAETLAEKPAFRAAFRRRRCLVPISGWYEWKGPKTDRQPYFIHTGENELMLLAGLWEAWRPEKDAEWVKSFTVVTGPPGLVSGDIHDRSPIVLEPSSWIDWLVEPPDVASDILAGSHEPASLTYHPVSKAVGSPRNHGPELVEPITL